jgi:hypothetical protein
MPGYYPPKAAEMALHTFPRRRGRHDADFVIR